MDAVRARVRRDFDLMGIQRHIKVAGIFARLWHRDGKPSYLDDIPLVLGYLLEVVPRYPELEALARLLESRSLADCTGADPLRAMILAAGRGERMRPLSDAIPKPLLEVAGKPLIVHAVESLVAAGFVELVVNLGYRGSQIRDFLEDGSRWGRRSRTPTKAAGRSEPGPASFGPFRCSVRGRSSSRARTCGPISGSSACARCGSARCTSSSLPTRTTIAAGTSPSSTERSVVPVRSG